MRYCCLSHCARGDHTAGPREVLSRRNWMPTASATSPMMPPKASTSRTRWPLAMPPMAGLQDICAMRSRLSVNRAVRRPIRAAAMAASQPACPAPTTSTSYCSVKGIPFSILPGLADSLAQQMKNPTLSHTARQDGARRIQGPSATFPKEEMVAYGKKLRSSGLAGTSRHRDTVDLGPEAGGDRRRSAAGALHGDARDAAERLEDAVRARSAAGGRRL